MNVLIKPAATTRRPRWGWPLGSVALGLAVAWLGCVALAAWLCERAALRSCYRAPVASRTVGGTALTEGVVGEVLGTSGPRPDRLVPEPAGPGEANPIRGSARPHTQLAAIHIRQGRHAGRVYVAEVQVSFNPASNIPLEPGDAVHLYLRSLDARRPDLELERLPLRFRDALWFGGLVAAGLLAFGLTGHLRCSGVDSAAARALYGWNRTGAMALNFRGLVSSAMVVALLGVTLDIAVAVGVRQVWEARPQPTFKQLFRAGMNIGRDLTGTMILTLVFAFLGIHLPILLYPQVMGLSAAEVVNGEAGSAELRP